ENKEGEVAAGVALDVFGAVSLAGGIALWIWGPIHDKQCRGTCDIPEGFLTALVAGTPLLAAAAPGFLIPGIILTRIGTHKPEYPKRPVSRITAGPGGVRVSF